MKICMLTRYYTKRGAGGHQAYIRNLSSFLIRFGDKVVVISQKQCGNGNGPNHRNQTDSALIIHVPFIDFPLLNVISLTFFFIKILKTIRKNFDLFVTHQVLPAALAASLVGAKPHIYTHHGFMYEHFKNKPIGKMYYILECFFMRFLSKKLACIIAVDLESSKRIEKYGVCTLTVPVFTNVKIFNPQVSGEEIRRKYHLDDCLVVLSPKMFYEITGVEYIIRAFNIVSKYLRNAKLLLVGDGLLKPTLLKLVESLKLEDKVIFAGVLPPSKMPQVYAASDVVVFHALGGIQRNALLEAMASGKPCIGTNISPFTEVVVNGSNGFLVESKAVQQLAEALKTILEDRHLRRRMGTKARKTIEMKYSRRIASEIRSSYERVVQSKLHGFREC